MKKALITGITGQDGSYLAEFLLDMGYEVHGTVRRASTFNTGRINPIYDRLNLHYADMTDAGSLYSVLLKVRPDEVYNLAAQSHVRVSFDVPTYTAATIAGGTTSLLNAIERIGDPVKFYQASSSEMFGSAKPPQCETTPFKPRSPYAVAKVSAFYSTVSARESGMFACNGILFNHESPRRGETFVTRKITRACTRIKMGLQDKLYLGNLDAYRDWGYAKEYVEAMWLMLQQEQPDDYVIATGQSKSVRAFLDYVCERLELNPREIVETDPRLFRPTEVDHLRGDYSKARDALGWTTNFRLSDLADLMIDEDMKLAQQEAFACSI